MENDDLEHPSFRTDMHLSVDSVDAHPLWACCFWLKDPHDVLITKALQVLSILDLQLYMLYMPAICLLYASYLPVKAMSVTVSVKAMAPWPLDLPLEDSQLRQVVPAVPARPVPARRRPP